MGDGLARILSKTSFEPENFIAKLSGDGEDALLDMRTKIHMLNDETAQALKKNVYKNYSQFIETAREISNEPKNALTKPACGLNLSRGDVVTFQTDGLVYEGGNRGQGFIAKLKRQDHAEQREEHTD